MCLINSLQVVHIEDLEIWYVFRRLLDYPEGFKSHICGNFLLCTSRKYPIAHAPQGRLTQIPRGRGSFKSPIFFHESVTLKWNFWRGWGFKLKNPSLGGVWKFFFLHDREGYGYFLEQHIINNTCKVGEVLGVFQIANCIFLLANQITQYPYQKDLISIC